MIEREKYYNIILYFADKIQNNTLGKVKLMKLLYYLDFDFFEKYGKPVTNDSYVRLPLGPVPRSADKIIDEMKSKGLIKVCRQKISEDMNDRQLVVGLKKPDLKVFSSEEMEMLNIIVSKWEKFSGKEMKDASHGEAPWIATKPNCVIDYNLAYYRNKYNEMEAI